MPDKVKASQPVLKEEKGNPMAKGVQNHVDLATRAWYQLCGVDQEEGVAGVGAGHPAAHCL